MAAQPAVFLQETIDRELPLLRAITEEQASAQPEKPGAWSRKQELGHLLDSAVNNHLRFMRAALEGSYQGPGYAQDEWVRLNAWHEVPWSRLLTFWQHHNAMLQHVMSRIPEASFNNICRVDSSPPVTLLFLMEDYILHLQHHVDHLLSRERLTQYPGAALGV